MASKISNTRKMIAQRFIKEHFGKISEREMARRLQIGKTSINRWARELGLQVPKHTVNESFFDNLNEKSSYILGFIFADGNVCWNLKKCYWALTITAAAKDKLHLEKMRKLMDSTKPLLYSESTNSYRLIVNSKPLCKKLMSMGVIPRKSLVVQFPNIPRRITRHFIRGVIDGDGTVRYQHRKRSPYFELKIFCGSKEFLVDLTKVIEEAIDVKVNIRRISENTYEANYSCSRGKQVARFIYEDATIFLKRKYEAYRVHVAEV